MSDSACDDHEPDEPEIIRRKFSLTRRHDDHLRKLANGHYAGNSSLCVRSAIEDHRCSLEGEDDPLLRQIADEINQTQETVDQLHEVLLNTDSEQMTGPTEEVGSKATMSSHKSLNDAMSEEMWLVSRRLLATHPTAQSVDELAESRELSATEVRHALIDLEDRGEVRSSRIDGVTQYTAVTDTVE